MRALTADATSLNLRQNVEWMECETLRRALEGSLAKREAARLANGNQSPARFPTTLRSTLSIGRNRTHTTGLHPPPAGESRHGREEIRVEREEHEYSLA